MNKYQTPLKTSKTILALGGESAGNFSIYKKNEIFHSDDFGDLLIDNNFKNFKKEVLGFLKDRDIKPEIILSDLHPLYKTSSWGKILARKYKAEYRQIQHHIAHILGAYGEKNLEKTKNSNFYGIAMDGTGYGKDGKIWGGEVFYTKINNSIIKKIERIGHLENQILIGNELAIHEPARTIISALDKIETINPKEKKEYIYGFVKKYYTRNEFELLYNQMKQNFNCLETSSSGRILDAVSVLLGFSKNERQHKHGPIELLEKNSTTPLNPEPVIEKEGNCHILKTSHLFKFLTDNTCGEKSNKRLAATAQLYLADGLYKIILKHKKNSPEAGTYFAGGVSNNKIISEYLNKKKAISNKKVPRGDAGLSFGQIIYYLLTYSGN